MKGINELKRRADALGVPAPAAPLLENPLPPSAAKKIGDLLALQRDPTEDEKRELKRKGETVFVTPETLRKIGEILESNGVKA
jgi:hypothetical protein